MKTIAHTLIATTLVTPLIAVPHAGGAESVLRVHTQAPGFERVLPALPGDMPWLTTSRRPPPKKPLIARDVSSIRAWTFVPNSGDPKHRVPVQSANAQGRVVGM